MVGADEVDGTPRPLAVVEKLFNPRVVRRGWAADTEPRINIFERRRRGLIQTEVVISRAGPERCQIWFVPDLEVPLCQLVAAIASDAVLCNPVNEPTPCGVIAGWRDIGSIAEHRS